MIKKEKGVENDHYFEIKKHNDIHNSKHLTNHSRIEETALCTEQD